MAGHSHAGMSAADLQAHLASEQSGTPGSMPMGGSMGAGHMMPDGSMMMPDGTIMMHSHASTYLESAEITNGMAISMSATQEEKGPLSSQVETTLTFTVFDKATGEPIDNLDLAHEKYMHIIGARSDLNEFFHIHAEKTAPGVWKATHIFAKAGTYKIYTDVSRGGMNYTIGHPQIEITGFKESQAEQISLAKNVIVGDYQVAIVTPDPVVAGSPTQIHFVVKTVYGLSVPLDNYLGVQMHLNALKQGNTRVYMHTHPDATAVLNYRTHESTTPFFTLIPTAYAHGGAADENTDPALKVGTVVPFTLTFPEPGIYKLFAQFRPNGATFSRPDEALVASFYVTVMPEGTKAAAKPIQPVSKSLSVTVSLILMSLFSYGVWRYLHPVKQK
jgi:hypothetical protein